MKPDMSEPGVLYRSELFIPYPSDFARNNLFWTGRCGWYHVNRNYMTSRTDPYEWRFLLFYVIEGEMTCITSKSQGTARTGELILIDARNAHIYAANTDTEFFWICFDGSSSEAFMERICRNTNIYTLNNTSTVSRMLFEFFEGLVKQKPIADEMFSAYMHRILSECLTQNKKELSDSLSAVQKITGYIESNYAENISFEELAAASFMSLSYFSQKFKRVVGCSPKQYLMKVRLNAARVLLRTTNLSVSEIAGRCGFSSDHYFSTYFKNVYKITPSEYR